MHVHPCRFSSVETNQIIIVICPYYIGQACQTSADFRGFLNNLGHSCDSSRSEENIIFHIGGWGSHEFS